MTPDVLQRVMDERGYLVMADARDLPPGYVALNVGVRLEEHGPLLPFGSVIILSRTDHDDFMVQDRMMGGSLPEHGLRAPYYYRVVSK